MELELYPVTEMPRIEYGDPIGVWLGERLRDQFTDVGSDDVLCVAQKVISKAEVEPVDLDDVNPGTRAREWGDRFDRDPREVQAIIDHARRIVHVEDGVIIAETHHGFICANAGLDRSNLRQSDVVLPLPEDPDVSAHRLRDAISKLVDPPPGVLITDTWGRPWRRGQVNFAIGLAGLSPFRDYRGETDDRGRRLTKTRIAAADELAAGAELVMGKRRGIPAVLIRGYTPHEAGGEATSAQELVRAPEADFFRE